MSSAEQECAPTISHSPLSATCSHVLRSLRSCSGADNERRLARKCAELSTQAVEASAKAQTAQVVGAKDTKTIATLKEEVDRAWAALESSHQKARPATLAFTLSARQHSLLKSALGCKHGLV